MPAKDKLKHIKKVKSKTDHICFQKDSNTLIWTLIKNEKDYHRGYVATQDLIETLNIYNNDFVKILAWGTPLGFPEVPDDDMIEKVDELELWTSSDYLNKNHDKLSETIRKYVFKAHRLGTKFRLCVEMVHLNQEAQNSVIEWIRDASIDSIQIGIGMHNYTLKEAIAFAKNLKCETKIVGNLVDPEESKEFLDEGIDLIGTTYF